MWNPRDFYFKYCAFGGYIAMFYLFLSLSSCCVYSENPIGKSSSGTQGGGSGVMGVYRSH